ncbi:3-oxoacyl-ACP reductase FabG [Fastidiosibacter lacustris]|uniref:3-oxoacyl-ACP reductase FabG n=1 Tax=Fastidiosibacter lacustris TaxID=2056695 RepID=UPI000E352757|nr:3-oxoacyl-ACP reductase FabG [Fastidiosibacter lacustris]
MRRVLVTGASKGIGQATAIMLAQSGFELVVHYNRDEEGARYTIDEIQTKGGQANLIQFNLENRQDCFTKLEQEIARNGAFYAIVNNAGICEDVAFPAMDAEAWDKIIHTNLDGFYNVLKPCIMPMIQLRKGGRIVTLASVSGIAGNRGQVNYSAAKSGIIGATKALALELAKRKITVNCVAPGLIETNMTSDLEYKDEIEKYIPMRRAGKAEEVASVINFLCSDAASYVTRQIISVNGGLI